MNEVTVQRIEDVEPYSGPGAREGIEFRSMARALGVTAWGMGLLKLVPGCTTYPEHDHAKDGQEEVYVVLEGSATLRADGAEWKMERGHFARVPPGVRRNWKPGDKGVTILAIGATPGKAYEPRR